MTPPPEKPHGKAVSHILLLLSDFLIQTADSGRYYVPRHGIALAPNTWLEPDLFYVSAETEAQSTGRYHTTADLVIEVISPGSAIYDRNTKADTYAALGVKELWLVDELSGLIEVRILRGNEYEPAVFERDDRVSSSVLQGFTFRVGEIFED